MGNLADSFEQDWLEVTLPSEVDERTLEELRIMFPDPPNRCLERERGEPAKAT